ncbi:hypothetical protein EVAR_44094_1 [Eumeta japonica]|uniref:Uncharacterized protein n=1 Tax=Eumeta variegata TaxID=151549 RepID=A0A4C1X4Q2_EUMVA|nr:hypothetical protein EVAR_44094_1 [Eumeta japonica]
MQVQGDGRSSGNDAENWPAVATAPLAPPPLAISSDEFQLCRLSVRCTYNGNIGVSGQSSKTRMRQSPALRDRADADGARRFKLHAFIYEYYARTMGMSAISIRRPTDPRFAAVSIAHHVIRGLSESFRKDVCCSASPADVESTLKSSNYLSIVERRRSRPVTARISTTYPVPAAAARAAAAAGAVLLFSAPVLTDITRPRTPRAARDRLPIRTMKDSWPHFSSGKSFRRDAVPCAGGRSTAKKTSSFFSYPIKRSTRNKSVTRLVVWCLVFVEIELPTAAGPAPSCGRLALLVPPPTDRGAAHARPGECAARRTSR